MINHSVSALRKKIHARQEGFTLLELVVVLVIIGLLIGLILAFQPQYRSRNQDNKRKADLQKMKTALENYAGDNECYPSPGLLARCGSQDLNPYLQAILCDPATKSPYMYVRSDDCLSYTIYTTLENNNDPAVAGVGCTDGCGPDLNGDGQGEYNYGVNGGQNAFGSGVNNGEVSPTCPNAAGQMRCIPNGSCGSCCPGVGYKCNNLGDACLPSPICN